MAFAPPPVRAPASIGRITLTLIDYGNNKRAGTYDLTILDANGDRIRLPIESGDLVPHLTPEQINGIIAFQNAIRQLAESGILGQG